jgi:DNA primase
MLSAEKDTPAEVIFTFDPDAAGQKAAMRAFNDSHKFSAQTFVAVGPEGLDPCDLRSQKGDEAVLQMIENKKPLFEFAIKQKISKFDLATIEGRVGAARAAAPVVAAIRDSAMRPAYIRELAGWVNLGGNEVAALVDAAGKESKAEAVKELRRDQPTNSGSSGVEQDDSVPPQDNAEQYPLPNLNDPITRFERQVLEVLVQVPASFNQEQLIRIVRDGFSAPAHNAILEAIGTSMVSLGSSDWLNVIGGATPVELHSQLRAIAAQALPAKTDADLVKYGQGVISRALINALEHEKANLLSLLKRSDVVDDADKTSEIQRTLVQIESERRRLQGI